LEISTCVQQVNYCKLTTPKYTQRVNYWKWIHLQRLYTLSIFLTVFEIFGEKKTNKKNSLLKKVCQGLAVPSWLGSQYVWNVCFNWELSLPWTEPSGQYFPKIRGGACVLRYFKLYRYSWRILEILKKKTVFEKSL